jgi:hypothetical protein
VSVYDEIAEERRAQDAKWGGPGHDDEHGPEMWISLVCKHARRGHDAFVKASKLPNSSQRGALGEAVATYRKQMVRAAALAVAAVEVIDRAPWAVEALQESAAQAVRDGVSRKGGA